MLQTLRRNSFSLHASLIHIKRLKMKPNEGTIDRALRVIAGLVLIALAATGTVGMWGWIGIMPLLTGAIGVCPAYSIFGLSTCPMKR